jgi:hypothetical protein
MGLTSDGVWCAGQRIRQGVSDHAVPHGTPGVIHFVWHESNLLVVGFDGDPALRIIGGDEVEPAVEE